jgi:hypothetical protein
VSVSTDLISIPATRFGARLTTCDPYLTAGTHVRWAERRAELDAARRHVLQGIDRRR